MSRKGKLPIPLPKGVEVKVLENSISVKGPKGSLQQKLIDGIKVNVENGQVTVAKLDEESRLDHFHGLYRALIQNMVIGTSTGFEKKLELIGVGYRATVQGSILDLQLGFSHPMQLPIPKGLSVNVEKTSKNSVLIISGFDKHLVGQFAAIIRSKRPPVPYQEGKGIRYLGEFVRKKAGKTATKGK